MPRLNDEDRLKNAIYEYVDKYGNIKMSIVDFNIMLERNRVDAVPVVRCKDCIHNYHNMIPCPEDYHECAENIELPITGDFYCAKGVRYSW